MMKFEVQDGIIRGLPIAILVTVLVQGSTFVWWLSARARDTHFLETRVSVLETNYSSVADTQTRMLERLGRIEERIHAQGTLLERIV